ncbi:multicopper oxidase domain-containing protein [Ornithinimicrobium sp. Y1694]|uniref:multicopper oxidase domain-containing protein n=1 Tax=Ornithinimicrobium sp. Y1694 TaxID=3418590 RepID=UPI003CF7428B
MTQLQPPGPSPPRPAPPPGRGTWALRDRPGVLWLVLAVLMTLVHPFVPASRWLMVHLVLLGALTHSIMVWSTHFTQALLKTRPGLDDRRAQSVRLWILLTGTAITLVGVPTAIWPLTLVGAVLVATAVLTHGVQLWRRLRAALPGRFRVTVRYYLAAAACLPVGVGLGATLAFGLTDVWHGRLLLAHVLVNILGWVGLTVTGTLLTLWPTMLRTRIAPGAERRATLALPLFVLALVQVLVGTLIGVRWLTLGALVLYAVSLILWGSAVLAPARTAPPREFAPSSVGAALAWWLIGLGLVLHRVATTPDWGEVAQGFGPVAAVLVVGFAAQLLTGALSYLIPSVLGGGRTVVRAGQRWFDRWGTARLVLINVGLVLCLLPVPSVVRVLVSTLVLAALATFIPLMFLGIRAALRAKQDAAPPPTGSAPTRPTPTREDRSIRLPTVWSGTQLASALATLALLVSVGLAADPATVGLGGLVGASGTSSAGSTVVTPTGQTTTVRVEAQDMRYEPSSITVPAGDRLVIELVNADPNNVHDLHLLGQRTARLAPGATESLDVGIVGADTQGWCTIVGHRQMGMVLDVIVTGPHAPAPGMADSHSPGGHGDGTGEGEAAYGDGVGTPTPHLDPDARVSDPVDPTLAPLGDEHVHQLTLTAQEVELEVAPGVTQTRWTFNGGPVGPTLHGRVGDVFEITLENDGTMGHSIDFHAGALAPDEPMRTIAPGESLVYTFTAERAGIWMYHCSTHPMSSHIAAGMTGAVIIEPADGLPPVDREYVVVQSEVYLVPGSGQGGEPAAEVDADALLAERPAFVVFNGIANQYVQEPFEAVVGERVRFWVLDAGPNRPSSFHIVGGQFDTLYLEGAYQLGPEAADAGAQALGLQAAQGGFLELTFPEAGNYPVVSHIMVDAERGAKGMVRVTDE